MVSRIIELEQRQAGEEDRTTRFVESARGTWTVVRRHRVVTRPPPAHPRRR